MNRPLKPLEIVRGLAFSKQAFWRWPRFGGSSTPTPPVKPHLAWESARPGVVDYLSSGLARLYRQPGSARDFAQSRILRRNASENLDKLQRDLNLQRYYHDETFIPAKRQQHLAQGQIAKDRILRANELLKPDYSGKRTLLRAGGTAAGGALLASPLALLGIGDLGPGQAKPVSSADPEHPRRPVAVPDVERLPLPSVDSGVEQLPPPGVKSDSLERLPLPRSESSPPLKSTPSPSNLSPPGPLPQSSQPPTPASGPQPQTDRPPVSSPVVQPPSQSSDLLKYLPYVAAGLIPASALAYLATRPAKKKRQVNV